MPRRQAPDHVKQTPPSLLGFGATWTGADGWRRWAAAFQAQLALMNRLTLLCRHAAQETQSARSPMELLSIQVTFQRALMLDCAAFTRDCLRAVGGLPVEEPGTREERDRSPREAVTPVVDAITQPIIDGMQAALFTTAAAPAAAFARPAQPAQPGERTTSRAEDAEAHAVARRSPEKSASRRKAAPATRRSDRKPQARREPEQKRSRARKRS